MKFQLTINTDNAAFDIPGAEVARILHKVAAYFDEYCPEESAPIFDSNGNLVGGWEWT